MQSLLPAFAVLVLAFAVPAAIDTLDVGPLDDTLFHLKRSETECVARAERLAVDALALERLWHDAKEEAGNALALAGESTADISSPRSVALQEHLAAVRLELENTKLLESWYASHLRLRRALVFARTRGKGRPELWPAVLDSARDLRVRIAEDCQWRRERGGESAFERIALAADTGTDGSVTRTEAAHLMEARRVYLARRLASDSLCVAVGEETARVIRGYESAAETALRNIPISQRARGALRRFAAVWTFEIRNVDGKPVTVGKIVIALLVIVFGLKLAQFISTLIARGIARRFGVDPGVTEAGQKLFYYGFAVLFSLYALHTVQVPLTAFTVVGGALALGIGFGSQNILSNFISGIILLVERPMKSGDFVEVDGAFGTVEAIGLRSTRVRTPANVHLVIPNSSFLEKNVVNWTLSDRLVRIELKVGVQYGSPVHEVKRLLLSAAKEVERVLTMPSPMVLFADFGDSSLVFDLLCWIRIIDVIDQRAILSSLRFKVTELFGETGIVIAFPQRDLHFDMEQPLRIRIDDADGDSRPTAGRGERASS